MSDRLTDEQLRRMADYVHPDEATDYVRPWLHSMAAELLALRARVTELEAAEREPIGRVTAAEIRAEAVQRVTALWGWLGPDAANMIVDALGDLLPVGIELGSKCDEPCTSEDDIACEPDEPCLWSSNPDLVRNPTHRRYVCAWTEEVGERG